jgi:lipopolysaccharide biosynthesis regulator YciM
LTIIERIRKQIRDGDYEFTIPHFFEELAEDELTLDDFETAIANGKVQRRFTRDPRGTRYEIVGTAVDGREVGVKLS